MNLTCPHCGKLNDEHDCLSSPGSTPEPGDITICIGCGGWAIFTKDALRLPTLAETFTIMMDPANVAIKKCWKQMNKERSKR